MPSQLLASQMRRSQGRDSDAGIVGWGRIHFKKWQFTILITQFGQNSSITAIQAILRSDVVVDGQ